MSPPLLITGVAGFIGSHLASALLARGRTVIGLDNFDRFYDRSIKESNLARLREHDAFMFVESDICDGPAMKDLAEGHAPEAIFHIAALAGVRPSIEDPARYTRVNLDGLTNMLEAARAIECRRFIFASSSSVYGNCKTVPFSEELDVSSPISPYAATKRSGELICHTYAHLFGLAIASLRFFTVYGPSQRPDLAIHKFMRLIATGGAIPMFGNGDTSRDYTYIDDIIAGVIAAYEWTDAHAATQRAFNLGGSAPVTLNEMIAMIAKTVGAEARIKEMPMQPGDVDRTYADLSRSTAELGYAPQTPFEEGLARQWAWLQPRL